MRACGGGAVRVSDVCNNRGEIVSEKNVVALVEWGTTQLMIGQATYRSRGPGEPGDGAPLVGNGSGGHFGAREPRGVATCGQSKNAPEKLYLEEIK